MAQEMLRVPAILPSGDARITNRIGDLVATIGSVDGVVKRNTFCLERDSGPDSSTCVHSHYTGQNIPTSTIRKSKAQKSDILDYNL